MVCILHWLWIKQKINKGQQTQSLSNFPQKIQTGFVFNKRISKIEPKIFSTILFLFEDFSSNSVSFTITAVIGIETYQHILTETSLC